jgi:hypothetical protein
VLRLCSPGDGGDLYKTSRSASFSEMMERNSGSGGAQRGGAPLLSIASFAALGSSPAGEDGSRLLAMGQGGGAAGEGDKGSLSPAPENFFGVVDVENKEDNKDGCLIFRLRVPFENTFKEIEFEFDLLEDDPRTVVAEMNEVEELMFMSDYADQIVQSISPVVELARKIAGENVGHLHSSDGSTRQPLLSDLVVELFISLRIRPVTPTLLTMEGLFRTSPSSQQRIRPTALPTPYIKFLQVLGSSNVCKKK